MVARVSSPIFVGRADELARATAVVAAAGSGPTQVVLISGEAGIGKTRFVQELSRRSRAAGALVLEGGCVPLGGDGLPFGPIIEMLRGLSRDRSPRSFAELLGPGRADLSRLLPSLPEATGPQVVPEGATQTRLFEQLLLLLGRLSAGARVLAVVEDLHWADRSTLELLSFLIRNLRDEPVVLLVTYRTDELDRRHPSMGFLDELARRGRTERIDLTRFDRQELSDLLEGILAATPDADLVTRIHLRSAGNAFFAEELLAAGAGSELHEGLKELLLARFERLSLPTQELLRAASASSGLISASLLGAVSRTAPQRVLAGLREAVIGHVLAPLVHGDAYSFRHALVQEAIYAGLLPTERRRIHAAFASAISRVAGSDGDATRLTELAYHWQAADDVPRAFKAAVQAGLASAEIYAFADAQTNFERALRLWDVVPDPSTSAGLDRVELLVRAAWCAEGTDLGRALAYVREAIGLVDASAQPARAGRLRRQLASYTWRAFDGRTATAISREAVRLVPPVPPTAARAEVLTGLARRLAIADHHEESSRVADDGLAVAMAVGASEREADVRVTIGVNAAAAGDLENGVTAIVHGRSMSSARRE